jgi:hypothetical protein
LPEFKFKVKFKIQKLERLCGKRATVYSVILEDDEQTLFERFYIENKAEYSQEVVDITRQILTMANKVGVQEQFFTRPEGKLGQDVWDLRDYPKKRLRLYCIKLSGVAIILGGGGPKPKGIAAFQEVPKLKNENYLIRMVSDAVTQRIRDKEIRWNGDEIVGNLLFEDDTTDEEDE